MTHRTVRGSTLYCAAADRHRCLDDTRAKDAKQGNDEGVLNVTHANQLPAYMFYSRFASTRGCCVRNLLSPCSLSNYQFPEPGPTGFSPCVEDFSKRLTTLSTTSPLVLKCFGKVAAACRGIEHNMVARAQVRTCF
jgi:hypothetical protein